MNASCVPSQTIDRYLDPEGRQHELLALRGHAGSTLVVDREHPSGAELLLAHLAADEPAGNAALVCRRYLESKASARRCRPVRAEDFRVDPIDAPAKLIPHRSSLEVRCGSFRLRAIASNGSTPQLRWVRPVGDHHVPLSLRDVIGALESYEPARQLTRAALERHRQDRDHSCSILRGELQRVLDSPIVLNRGLRDAVLARVRCGQASMSEIAIRCGRLKRDSRGNESGETSWLARRIGLLPEGGQNAPTPWVHSEVLALIAWKGLGLSPREVELG